MSFQERRYRLQQTYPKRTEWWSRVFATPGANLLLWAVADWPVVTPRRLTSLSFLMTLATCAVILWDGPFALVAAGVMLQFAYVLDCMDGQLARYRKSASRAGSFYDKWCDVVKFPLVLAALALLAWQRSGTETPLFLGMAGIFLVMYLPLLKYAAERELSLRLWPGLSGRDFVSRNLRFFLFEEAQWYLLVSVCLVLNRPLLALALMVGTQLAVAVGRTWRVFHLERAPK